MRSSSESAFPTGAEDQFTLKSAIFISSIVMSSIFRCRKRMSEFRNFPRTSIIHVPFSRRHRNLYLFDPRDDRSVRSALFPKIYRSSCANPLSPLLAVEYITRTVIRGYAARMTCRREMRTGVHR